MEIQNNPNPEAYLAHLNECFTQWGDRRVFDWVFNDVVGPRSPDRFVMANDGELLAGSALTFRRLSVPGQPSLTMGTMTGSWTLPAARGKGCFTQIIAHSLHLVAQHQVHYLTAFVTEQNASFRRLAAAGSALLRTHYVVGKTQPHHSNTQVEVLEKNIETLRNIYDLRREKLVGSIHYEYSFEEFQTQFIHRPSHEIKLLKVQGQLAVVEETQTTCRILYASSYELPFIEALSAWAAAFSKNIFFMSSTDVSAFKGHSGYELIPGYFTILAAADHPAGRLLQSAFVIEYGDKM